MRKVFEVSRMLASISTAFLWTLGMLKASHADAPWSLLFYVGITAFVLWVVALAVWLLESY